jgi:hypothetical protein
MTSSPWSAMWAKEMTSTALSKGLQDGLEQVVVELREEFLGMCFHH